jgi:hypothetical protein
MRAIVLVSAVLCAVFASPSVEAGRIVVNHDEWTTSDTGFSQAGADATTFVQNLANFLNPGGGFGTFLAYSSDFSLTGASFANALTSAGHSLTVSTAITFDLPTLVMYDAVFLAGQPGANTTVLTDYVNAGGNVYLAGGTFLGGNATGEASAWNPFLNNFGLGFQGGSYNGISGVLPVTGIHPILNGVADLYYNNGNTVVLVGGNPNAQIVQGPGLIGVYDDVAAPEPGGLALLGLGLAALASARRKSH